MKSSQALVLAIAIVVLIGVIELLRRRALREKYAALWLVVALAVVVFAAVPGWFASLSRLLGFGLPVNMAFAGAVTVLLLVSMQLSLESGRREDETQRLAEEVALLQLELDELRKAHDQEDDEPA